MIEVTIITVKPKATLPTAIFVMSAEKLLPCLLRSFLAIRYEKLVFDNGLI
ncbi:MAG: hypothetical protein ACJAWV_000787 [Flammeovirgaceae bacterium]|jgi:hypothetical protein